MHRTYAPVPVIDRVALVVMGIAILVAAAVEVGLGKELGLAVAVFVLWMLAIPLLDRMGDSDGRREPALKPGELSWPGLVWAWLAITFCFCWALCLGWKEVMYDELKARRRWQKMSWLNRAFLGCILLVAGVVLMLLSFAGIPWKLGMPAGIVALLVGWRLNREPHSR